MALIDVHETQPEVTVAVIPIPYQASSMKADCCQICNLVNEQQDRSAVYRHLSLVCCLMNKSGIIKFQETLNMKNIIA